MGLNLHSIELNNIGLKIPFAERIYFKGRAPDYYASLRKTIIAERGLTGHEFGRASIAHYWGDYSILKEAAINIPRIDTVGGRKALLGEPAGTNKLLYCRDLSQACWIDGLSSKSQNEIGIDGVANKAWTVEDSDAVGYAVITQIVDIATDTNTHILYCLVKKDTDETRFPGLRITLKTGGVETAQVISLNTKTGAVDENVAFNDGDYGSVAKGDWWLIWVSAVNDGSNTKLHVDFFPALGSTLGATNAAGEGTCVIDWFQVEFDKKFPSSPIYTEGSEITRATESGYPRWSLPADKLGTGNMFGEALDIADPDDDCADDDTGDWTTADCTITFDTDHYEINYVAHTQHTFLAAGVAPIVGDLYKLSIEVKNGTSISVSGALRISSSGFGVRGMTLPFTTTNAWVPHTGYGIPTTGAEGLDIFSSMTGAGNFEVRNVKMEKVTNAWNNMPPHGTVVLRWRPGFDGGDISMLGGIIGCREGLVSLMYSDESMCPKSNDSTTQVTNSLIVSSDTWYKLVLQYGYLSDNVAKMRVGADTGSGISWGSAADYDGAFEVGPHLLLNYNLQGPCHIRDIQIYKRILSDTEINSLGSP